LTSFCDFLIKPLQTQHANDGLAAKAASCAGVHRTVSVGCVFRPATVSEPHLARLDLAGQLVPYAVQHRRFVGLHSDDKGKRVKNK
jgi:hypothetical protein